MGKKQNPRIVFHLSADLHAWAFGRARELGQTISEFVRRLIEAAKKEGKR